MNSENQESNNTDEQILRRLIVPEATNSEINIDGDRTPTKTERNVMPSERLSTISEQIEVVKEVVEPANLEE